MDLGRREAEEMRAHLRDILDTLALAAADLKVVT